MTSSYSPPTQPPDSAQPDTASLPDVPLQPLEPTPEFLAAAAELKIEFEPTDLPRLGLYLAALLETNKKFNLTAIREPAEAWMRHILDALGLLPLLAELPEGARLIDIGSGGGVPAIPLAIVTPGFHFTLVEATGKKAAFLNQVVQRLGLTNVTVLAERAERLGQDRKAHREKYDAATARALGALAIVAELTVPLIKVGGLVLAIKGQRAEEELAAAQPALVLLGAVHEQTLETPTGRVVVLSKVRPTPRDYPRRDGEPARVPLGQPRPGSPGGAPSKKPARRSAPRQTGGKRAPRPGDAPPRPGSGVNPWKKPKRRQGPR